MLEDLELSVVNRTRMLGFASDFLTWRIGFWSHPHVQSLPQEKARSQNGQNGWDIEERNARGSEDPIENNVFHVFVL